jgi:hypothetical protein
MTASTKHDAAGRCEAGMRRAEFRVIPPGGSPLRGGNGGPQPSARAAGEAEHRLIATGADR